MVFLLPARMKEIQSKMKALEWSQHYSFIFRRSRAANAIELNGMLTKCKLIQSFKVVLLPAGTKKNHPKLKAQLVK